MPYIDTTTNAQAVYFVNGDPTSATAGQAGSGGAVPIRAVNAQGNATSGNSYQLATNATIAATSGNTPITGVSGGVYIWDAQFTGTSVVLQSLGADSVTWRTVATLAASGTFAGEISIGANATIRLYNPNGTSDTAVSSSLAQTR